GAADERAAGGSGGRDRDGAQTGTDRLPGAQARDDVRASESGGVRGADEGQADQGVAAEGTPVGAGGSRGDVGQRAHGSRSVGARGKRGSGDRGRGGIRRRGGTGKREGGRPARPGRGTGREQRAPRRTLARAPLGALNKLAAGRFPATPLFPSRERHQQRTQWSFVQITLPARAWFVATEAGSAPIWPTLCTSFQRIVGWITRAAHVQD